MNSEPERRSLDAEIKSDGWDPQWWDEPSAKRGSYSADQAWTDWTSSARKAIEAAGSDVTVVAHSFGAQAIDQLLADGLSNVARLVYVSPVLDIYDVTKRMFRAAQKDFEKAGDQEKADLLNEAIEKTRSFNDQQMQSGLQLALQDPALFGNYWKNMDAMQSWGGVLGEADWGFDFGNMQAVYAELANDYDRFKRVSKTDVPTLLICTDSDPVVTEEYTKQILGDRYTNLKTVKYTESSHFCHLEEKAQFRSDLRDLWK